MLIKRVVLAVLLVLIAPKAWAGPLFFDGFEQGSLGAWNTIQGFSAVSSTVRTGAYAAQTTTQGNFFFSPTFAGGTQATFRIGVNLGLFSANLTGATAVKLVTFGPSWEVDVVTDGANPPNNSLQLFNGQTSLNIGSACAAAAGWHYIEGKDIQSATVGVLGLKIDGTLCFESAANLNTGTGNITNLVPQDFPKSGTPTANVTFDDAFAETGTTYPGNGGTIARSMNSSSADVWGNIQNCGGIGHVYGCWATTPTAAASYAESSTSTQKQTGPLDWTITSATGSTGHGAQILHLADTVNAAKVAVYGCTANTSGDAADSLGFTGNGLSEVDVALGAVWGLCAGAYQETNIASTPTAAQTIGSSIQAIHAANTTTHRIQSLWMMIDYTIATVVAPKGSVILS